MKLNYFYLCKTQLSYFIQVDFIILDVKKQNHIARIIKHKINALHKLLVFLDVFGLIILVILQQIQIVVQSQGYSTGCTSVSNGTQCQDLKQACEQYLGTTFGCTQTTLKKCYLHGSTCIPINNVEIDCAKITGQAGSVTYDICQSYNSGCSVNRTRSACIQQQVQCSGYTVIENCYKSEASLCIASTYEDITCIAVSTAITCDALYLGTGNYSSANCNEMRAGCTNNGTIACIAKTCTNAVIVFNHVNCNNWLNTCTVNTEYTACQTMAYKCVNQSQFSCNHSVEGECVVVGTSCVRKTCDTAATDSIWDHTSKCSSYLQSCTVVRLGGCQVRTNCSLYKSSIQCKFNTKGQKCFWNPTYKSCIDLNCANIETTFLFNSHDECVAVDEKLACTVRAINGAAIQGCMSRGACSSYTIEEQCQTNLSGGFCAWNTNKDQPACQDKSCNSAPIHISTHNDCYAYYKTETVKCTVVAIPSNNDGNLILGGCQQTTDCQSYIVKEQCQINSKGYSCGWNGTQCSDKSCATAPASDDYDDDTKCREYMNNKCTVSDFGQGCVDIPITCEIIMTQKQCYFNKAGDPCYWTGKACITRSCENAPDSTGSENECNTYLAGCTLDNIKCKIKICEDFEFATDNLCKQANSLCTSIGKNCATRGSCLQALDQAGCVTSSTGEQCEWIPEIDINLANYTIKTCSTAPYSLKTEELCQQYFPNCTTKKEGGCVTKSTCPAATVESACTIAFNGQICVWDIINQLCRNQDCQDFDGSFHKDCQLVKGDCTVGVNGKCAKIHNCEQTQVRAACIEGLNGPCLWIDHHINDDGSIGACFQYTSCQSLIWNSDQQCKKISNECTTDGSKCVAITLCSETNTNGGCVTGYDGNCIQSAPAINSLYPEVCQLFTFCENALYITHEQCQKANSKCTTNGTSGCIGLSVCTSYVFQAGCFINKTGLVISSGVVISTGLCTWSEKQNSCREQDCSDYKGFTHRECSAFLSTCTSNGETCILKGACSYYKTQTTCETAVGSEGICFWEYASQKNNNNASCRQLVCQDIENSISSNECLTSQLNCFLDVTICIPKANCSTYTSKIACNSGGLDGICVFTQKSSVNTTGTCTLMKECSTANNDQNACQAAKNRCLWTPVTTTGGFVTPSQCAALTCATNQEYHGHCTRFFNWDQKSQQMCVLQHGNCVNPSDLSQNDCLKISGHTYTWNSQKNQCQVCKPPKPNTNQNNDIEKTNENIQSTSFNYILNIIGMVVINYLI